MWTGWIRPNDSPNAPWRLWCTAATDAECWAEVLKAPREHDRLVRQGSNDPNNDRRPK